MGLAEQVQKTVEEVGRNRLEEANPRSVDTDHLHHTRAAAPRGEHLGKQFGRVLQIAIERHDHGAAHRLQAGHQRPDARNCGQTLARIRAHEPLL